MVLKIRFEEVIIYVMCVLGVCSAFRKGQVLIARGASGDIPRSISAAKEAARTPSTLR